MEKLRSLFVKKKRIDCYDVGNKAGFAARVVLFKDAMKLAPDGMPPPYLRILVGIRRAAAVPAAERLLRFHPDRVIFAHGHWFDTNATRQLQRSLRWLLG